MRPLHCTIILLSEFGSVWTGLNVSVTAGSVEKTFYLFLM